MAERQYTKTHEWLTVDGKMATVGITDFAQAQLGDVVFLDLPKAIPDRRELCFHLRVSCDSRWCSEVTLSASVTSPPRFRSGGTGGRDRGG